MRWDWFCADMRFGKRADAEEALEAQELYDAGAEAGSQLPYALLTQAPNWDLLNDVDPNSDREQWSGRWTN